MDNYKENLFNSNFIKKSMTDIRESDKIYHKCFNKNKDRTNKLIKKAKNVLLRHILLFGNLRGIFQMELELVRKKKNKKRLQQKSLLSAFKISKIFNGG